MQKLMILASLASLQGLLLSCHLEATVTPLPVGYDVLARAEGRWEWDSTAYQTGMRTPVTQKFSRQLIFGTDSLLRVHRNGKISSQTSYHLSGTLQPTCVGLPTSLQALVTFTSDGDMPNSESKGYGTRLSALGPKLCLTGVNHCIDAGVVEFYHWVAGGDKSRSVN